MSQPKNDAPRPLSNDELDVATGGAVGINPLLLLASGGQGIYAQSAEPAPLPDVPVAHAAVTTGANPLYVDNTHLAGPAAPVYHPPAATPTPAPTPAATPTVDHGVSPGHEMPTMVVPTPVAAHSPVTPAHDSPVIVQPSATMGMGNSLDIPAPHASGPLVITGTISATPLAIDFPKEAAPDVTILTFNTQPGAFTQVIPTVDPKRSAGWVPHPGDYSSLENAFDLHLVNKT